MFAEYRNLKKTRELIEKQITVLGTDLWKKELSQILFIPLEDKRWSIITYINYDNFQWEYHLIDGTKIRLNTSTQTAEGDTYVRIIDGKCIDISRINYLTVDQQEIYLQNMENSTHPSWLLICIFRYYANNTESFTTLLTHYNRILH